MLADLFGGFADTGFNAAANGATLSLFEAWYATLSYALQIYFDFSGYSGISFNRHHNAVDRLPPNRPIGEA